MTASKKKQRKNEDFKKPKLKVGKKKLKPESRTDTSFRAQSVQLPTQSIVEQKNNIPTDFRNHSIMELLTMVRHYSPSSRKDAIQGLRNLYKRYPECLKTTYNQVLPLVCRLVIDSDNVVRKTLLGFFNETICHLSPLEITSSNWRLFCAHILSGLSHIDEWIRDDALEFLDMINTQAPSASYDSRAPILENYLRLLEVDSNLENITRKVASTNLEKKIRILSSLSIFIDQVVSKQLKKDEFWFINTSESRNSSITIHWVQDRPIYVDLVSLKSGLLEGATTKPRDNNDNDDDIEVLKIFAKIRPLLSTIWQEYASALSSPSTKLLPGEVNNLIAVLNTLNIIWRRIYFVSASIEGLEASSHLESMIQQISIFFPFNVSIEKEKLMELNCLFVEIAVARLYHIGGGASLGGEAHKQNLQSLTEILVTFLSDTFQDDRKQTNAEQLAMILPGFWMLVNQPDLLELEQRESLMMDFLNYCTKLHPQASAKRKAIGFMERVLKQPFEKRSLINRSSQIQESIKSWILTLPKLLWSLKGNYLETSLQIVQILIEFIKISPDLGIEFKQKLQKLMIPFFYAQSSKGPVFGPFVILPSPIQERVMELACYWLQGQLLLPALKECIIHLKEPTLKYAHCLLEALDSSTTSTIVEIK